MDWIMPAAICWFIVGCILAFGLGDDLDFNLDEGLALIVFWPVILVFLIIRGLWRLTRRGFNNWNGS